EVPVARLQLREQADVLDRDHRLIGEGFQQLDFVVGERPRLLPVDDDRPDRGAAAKDRYSQQASEALSYREGAPVLMIQSDVGNLDERPAQDRPARDVS